MLKDVIKETKMNIIKVKNYQEVSNVVCKILVDQVKENESSVLSLTSGASPLKAMKLFIQAVNNGLDISKCTFMNLDEYVCNLESEYSVYTWMQENIYSKLLVKPKEIYYLQGDTDDLSCEILRYQKICKENQQDIQIIGLGVNGHIGGNEPGTEFDSTLAVTNLNEDTIKNIMKQYEISFDEAPKQMITMGFKEIMNAKHIVVIASGKSKSCAVKKLIDGEIIPEVPVSFLKNHNNLTLVIDEDAASKIEKNIV